MRRFFIYSLPRSGSSWLSMFFSQPGSFCYHEPLADGGWGTLIERMEQRPEACVGAIDTSAYQRPALPPFPRSCIYVLIRNKMDIANSLRLRGWVVDLAKEDARFESVTRSLHPIFFNYLWEVRYLEDLWGRIVGSPFDQERAEFLIEMNIQRTFASIKARVERAAY